MKLRSGVQIPVRSGLPSDAFGVGPAGRAFSLADWASAVPPPAGSVGASCAKAAVTHKPNIARAALMDIETPDENSISRRCYAPRRVDAIRRDDALCRG